MGVKKTGEWTRAEIEEEILPKCKGITIPVNVKFEVRQTVHDLSSVNAIPSKAETIAFSECACGERVRGCDPSIQERVLAFRSRSVTVSS